MTHASRSVHPVRGAPKEAGVRGRWTAVLVVAAGIPLGLYAGSHPGRWPDEAALADEGDAAPPTPNVLVAMHLDEPLPAERTVVWTVGFQAAWDALDRQARARWGVPRLDLGPPAPPADVKALAEGRLLPGIVDPADLTVIAGPATEETWSAIDRASDLGRPAGAPPPRAADLAAFARLKASIRYDVPFRVETRPIMFGAPGTAVRGYGLEANASGADVDRMREQVDLHLEGTSHEDKPARRAVVVLKGTGGRRVVISGRPPKATLRETWEDVATAMRSTPPRGFSVIDRLTIPRVSVVAGRSFDALVGAAILGVPDSMLAVAREDVRLTADEKGADVDAEGVAVALGAIPLVVVFDGPFLLAMCAAGSDRPYALAWIGSADGLSRWDEPAGRRLSAGEARPFAGSWTLDRDASLEATLARWTKALGRSAERERTPLRRHFAEQTFDATIAPDGLVTLELGRGAASRATARAPLVRDGARVLLAVSTPHAAADPDEADERQAEARWFVAREGSRLILAEVGSGVNLVLVRR